MKLLFICNFNQNRSVTAEHLFKDKYETKSAGVISGTPITKHALEWADKVFVMEEPQKLYILKNFPAYEDKIINLNIPNNFFRDQEDLKKLLQEKVNSLL